MAFGQERGRWPGSRRSIKTKERLWIGYGKFHADYGRRRQLDLRAVQRPSEPSGRRSRLATLGWIYGYRATVPVLVHMSTDRGSKWDEGSFNKSTGAVGPATGIAV